MNELQVFICGTAEAVNNRKGVRPLPYRLDKKSVSD